MTNFNQPWNQPYGSYNGLAQYPNANGNIVSSINQQMNTAPQTPAFAQMAAVPMLSGKTVNNPQEILPQDVPMNGFTSYFPKADGSEIYAKCWNSNGTIDTKIYILKPLEEQVSQESDIMSQILSRLENIERKVSYKPKYQNQRKEVKPNE